MEHKLRSRGLNDEGIPHCPLAPANLDSDMDQTDTDTSYGLVGNYLNFTYDQNKQPVGTFFQLFLVTFLSTTPTCTKTLKLDQTCFLEERFFYLCAAYLISASPRRCAKQGYTLAS